jgi:hypothetical protein
VNPSLADVRLLRADGEQRLVIDRFDEAVAERIEGRPERADVLRGRDVLLRLGNQRRSLMMERPAILEEPSSIGTVGFTNVPLASR